MNKDGYAAARVAGYDPLNPPSELTLPAMLALLLAVK